VGLYGVMAYTVARRRVEIGIRMALGATRKSVVGMVVREAAVLLLIGVAAGTALSVFAAGYTESLLYDLRRGDPASLLLAAAALGTVTIAASCIPAWRASRLEPTRALREE
jgi:ABC-type antimicrobial peptide transport system permease subunit